MTVLGDLATISPLAVSECCRMHLDICSERAAEQADAAAAVAAEGGNLHQKFYHRWCHGNLSSSMQEP